MFLRKIPYWQRKTLSQMSAPEWEALCDGCGQCCQHKIKDDDTGKVYPTRVSCQLLNTQTCQCSDYGNRHATVPDCVTLTVDELKDPEWLPTTCAYRLLAEGKDLEWWHPLVSGDPNTVHTAGVSVRGKVINELDITDDVEEYMETVTNPCNDHCELDSDFVCIGCKRTIYEILKWDEYTEDEKQSVLNRIKDGASNT
jgi:hypothetical protein